MRAGRTDKLVRAAVSAAFRIWPGYSRHSLSRGLNFDSRLAVAKRGFVADLLAGEYVFGPLGAECDARQELVDLLPADVQAGR